MTTPKELANEFNECDLEAWIAEIETRISNVKYPSNADVSLLPKLKEALVINQNVPVLSDEEIDGLCMDSWAEEHELEFM